MSIVGDFRNFAGQAVAGLGGRLIPNSNIRITNFGSQGLGAAIAGVSKPFFDNRVYAENLQQPIGPQGPTGPTLKGPGVPWTPSPIINNNNNPNPQPQGETEQQSWDRQWREAGNQGPRPEGYHGSGGGNNLNDFNAMIDQDYNSAMTNLGNMETGLRGQADTATSGANADYGKVKTAIGEEQATREAGLAREGQLATTNAKTATQQARDLFRETQQANIAQMSGLGISSSSVSEALAERLGVETARRIAGITGSTQEIMQNLSAEKTRVQTFFKEKLTNLEQQLTVAKQGIQDSLMAGIQQLNNARSMAASDKANRRAELLSNAQTAYYKAQEQKTQFEQAMKIWTENKNSALDDAQKFLINPTDFGAQTAWANQVSRLGQDTGFNYQPTFEPTATGQLKRSMTIKKDEEDDELANPFGA